MTSMSLLSVFVFFAITLTMAQDMRENCVSCADTQRLCELDCMLPTYREAVTVAWPKSQPESYVQMTSCLSICTKKASVCVETPQQKACLSCMENCSYIYEAGMLDCLQAIVDVTAKATVDDTMDDCSNNASTTMSICAETCYEKDLYFGWTPSTEEGVAAEVLGAEELTIPTYRTPKAQIGVEALDVFDTMNALPVKTENDQQRRSPPSSGRTNAQTMGQSSELIHTDSTETTADDSGSLGLAGVIGVSGLFAAVVVSVGFLTKTGLVKARIEFQGSYQNKRPELQKVESMRS